MGHYFLDRRHLECRMEFNTINLLEAIETSMVGTLMTVLAYLSLGRRFSPVESRLLGVRLNL